MASNPWDVRYDVDEFYYGTEPNDFLRDEAHRLSPGARVLCLADGEGRNGVFLAQQGCQVVAVDGSRVGLDKGQRLAASRGVTMEAVCADLAVYEVGEARWDGIASIWCHLPQPLRREVHAKCVAGLKPGGWFLLEAYHPRQLGYGTGGPPTTALMMTLDALREELEGLELVRASELDRDVQEGGGHQGMSAVVQVVARKPLA